MRRFQNKSDQCLSATALVGALLSLTAGCEKATDPVQSEREILPAIEDPTQKTETPQLRAEPSKTETPRAAERRPTEPRWIGEPVSLFDGKSLEGWETIEFGGQGDSRIVDGRLTFDAGDPFTGISSTSEGLPNTNYEVSLEARKMEGTDFFCGLTFPVSDSHCTLIVGGWGGSTVGLSSIDGKDASSNTTCTHMKFEKEQWYKIRVRVQPENISVWIDDKEVVNQDIKGRKISLRGDTELCKPMGICSFMTVAEYRNLQIRQFKPMENSADSASHEATEKYEDVKQK